jgi:YidC/Oxa1 family membrane protein insertase
VGKQRAYVAFVLVLLLLLTAAPTVWAEGNGKSLSYQVIGQEPNQEIQVTTGLSNYVFSKDQGTLKSDFLSFAPYGSSVTELVPGTKTDPKTLKRQYTANTVFPFSVQTTSSTVAQDFTSTIDRPSKDVLVLTFMGKVGGATVTKTLTIHNDPYYTIGVELSVDNPSPQKLPLRMAMGDYIPSSKGPQLTYMFDNTPGNALLAKGSYTSFDGLGLMDKATVFYLKVDQAAVSPFVERLASGNQLYGVSLDAPSGKSTYTFTLYGGRRRYVLMAHSGLGPLDNPGAGARMIIPVVQFLNLLYRYTGNYGWAIILFTLLTRLILFPLMRKQYHSMAKMQRLQPSMKKIQERFKSDRQLMQKKLMELYKKEGVNPMGGCLPMLIQLPILILLWKAILYSAEQIHFSPGFMWITDLSLRDPYFILVILTTAVTMLQQRLMTPMTSGEGGGTQKYMGYLFPILMALFLYNFPAGLWLYYFLTTLTQVAQQLIVNRELAASDRTLAPAMAGDGGEYADDTEENGDGGDDQGGD